MKKHILMIGCVAAAAFTLAGCSRENVATKNATQQQVSVTVAQDGSFFVAGQRCSAEDLASKLRQIVAGGTTAIIQNRGVSSNQFTTMLQACSSAGVQRIVLATAIEQGQFSRGE